MALVDIHCFTISVLSSDWSYSASFHTSFELHLVTVQMNTDKTVLDKYHHQGP